MFLWRFLLNIDDDQLEKDKDFYAIAREKEDSHLDNHLAMDGVCQKEANSDNYTTRYGLKSHEKDDQGEFLRLKPDV